MQWFIRLAKIGMRDFAKDILILTLQPNLKNLRPTKSSSACTGSSLSSYRRWTCCSNNSKLYSELCSFCTFINILWILQEEQEINLCVYYQSISSAMLSRDTREDFSGRTSSISVESIKSDKEFYGWLGRRWEISSSRLRSFLPGML